nr:hypothetical protein CFP56_24563 [Quercus suber]
MITSYDIATSEEYLWGSSGIEEAKCWRHSYHHCYVLRRILEVDDAIRSSPIGRRNFMQWSGNSSDSYAAGRIAY